MTDEERRTAGQVKYLEDWGKFALDWSGKLSAFCASTGLTNEHLAVARLIPTETLQHAAIKWTIENGATPSEMMAWCRLNQDG